MEEKEEASPSGQRAGTLHWRQGFYPKDTVIIAFLGESIKDDRESFLLLLERLELRCPYCSSSTHWHCWYQRFIKGGDCSPFDH